jgi:hypothetical protein
VNKSFTTVKGELIGRLQRHTKEVPECITANHILSNARWMIIGCHRMSACKNFKALPIGEKILCMIFVWDDGSALAT